MSVSAYKEKALEHMKRVTSVGDRDLVAAIVLALLAIATAIELDKMNK